MLFFLSGFLAIWFGAALALAALTNGAPLLALAGVVLVMGGLSLLN